MKPKAGVYKFTNLVTGTVYIGSSIDIGGRYKQHLGTTRSKSKRLGKAIEKYGITNFSFEILENIENFNDFDKKGLSDYLFQREQIYLNKYFAKEYFESGAKDKRFTSLTYNLNPIAGGGRGFKWSEESIKKLKEKFKREGHTCKGRKYSQETINKMKATHKLKGVSVGARNPNYGRKSTPEKRAKMVKTWFEHGRLKPFVAIKDNQEFGPYITSSECAEALNIWKCQVKKCLAQKPRYKSASGYTFKYTEQ